MARITRKELKTDKFALEVEHTVNFFEEHQKEIIRYGGIGLVVVGLVIGWMIYSRHQHTASGRCALAGDRDSGSAGRAAATGAKPELPDTGCQRPGRHSSLLPVDGGKYPGSAEARDRAVLSGVDPGRPGKTGRGREELQGSGAEGRCADTPRWPSSRWRRSTSPTDATRPGRKLLRDLIAHPTLFVSKEQATISLARYLAAEEAGRSPQAAGSAAQPARRRRTGGPVGLRPNCRRSRSPPLSCWRACDFR